MSAPGRFVLAAALLFGALFAAVTPPFQTPDEPAHFYRAYLVSEGRLDLLPARDRTAAPLPVSVHRIGTDLLAGLPFHPERKIAPRAILEAFRIPLTPGRREPVFFHNTLQYTFLPYVPQAIGIAAGRLLGAPPLALLYLARLTNLLCGALAIAFAVRRLPALAWLAAMVALTPMSLSLLGSVSADVTTIASSFLLVSTVAKLAWGTEAATRGDLLWLAAAAAVLCASKPPYLPLVFLALLIPTARFPRGRWAGFLLLYLPLSLLMASWEVVLSRTAGFGRLDAGVDPGRQIHGTLLHPFRFLRMTFSEYARHSPEYFGQVVGKLGWLDVELPLTVPRRLCRAAPGAGLPGCEFRVGGPALAEGRPGRRRPRGPGLDRRRAIRDLDPVWRAFPRGYSGAISTAAGPAGGLDLPPPELGRPDRAPAPGDGARGVQPALLRDRSVGSGGAVLRSVRPYFTSNTGHRATIATA